MAKQVFPTKSNLISTRKSLSLAKLGYELMDRKRNILVREMMELIDKANEIQGSIDSLYADAYIALQRANVTLGICDEAAQTIPIDESVELDSRSVMGVEIPIVRIGQQNDRKLHYGLYCTNSQLDEAYIMFDKVKHLTAELAQVENSVYRLATAIKKRQKRANALHNIMIPQFESTIKFINEALEEKEREDFSRLKAIKSQRGPQS